MVCSPEDALDMFFGSDLEYLALEDYLVTKVREEEGHEDEGPRDD
jgi:carbamoyltransferase